MNAPRLDEGSEREAYPPMPEAEDFMYQHEETGITGYIDAQQVEWGFFKNNPRLHKVHGVYNEAQMRAYVDADRASRAALSTGRLGGEAEEKTLILLSTGEYSDYSVMGAFRPTKSFNMGDVLEAFNAQWKPEEGAYTSEPGPNDFAAWLAKEGYIEDARTEEIHFGSYGELELSDESKALNFSAPAAKPQGDSNA